MRPRDRYEPADWFVIRTPLLAREQWATLPGDPWPLGALHEHARRVLGQDVVQDALRLAGSGLLDALPLWSPGGEDRRSRRLDSSVARYLARLSGRPGPFGLFAGQSLGTVDATSPTQLGVGAPVPRLVLDPTAAVRIARRLADKVELRDDVAYRVGSTVVRAAGGRIRYVRRKDSPGSRHELVTLAASRPLERVLELCGREGLARGRIVAELCEHGVGSAAAQRYVADLIEREVLESCLAPPVTAGDPLAWLEQEVGRLVGGAAAAADLSRLARAIDRWPDGREELSRALHELGEQDSGRQLAIGGRLTRSGPAPRLSRHDARRIAAAAGLASMVCGERLVDPLATVRERFRDRFEGREVPLVAALDPETGVGLDGLGDPWDRSNLPPVPWSRQRVEAALIARARASGTWDTELTPPEIEQLSAGERRSFPREVLVTVALQAAGGGSAADIHLLSVGTPPVRLLARYAARDDDLARRLRELPDDSEPDSEPAVIADVVSLPRTEWAGVVARAPVHPYEIEYMGTAAAAGPRRVRLEDLTLSLAGDRFVLRAPRLRSRLRVRCTTMLTLDRRQPPLLRFLGYLELQDARPLAGWRWSEQGSDHYPRVRVGGVVLALERWMVWPGELDPIREGLRAERPALLGQWRKRRGIPRHVKLLESQAALSVDLENPLDVEALLRALHHHEQRATLEELWPAPGRSAARGSYGDYAHELVIPMSVRSPGAGGRSSRAQAAPTAGVGFETGRSFLPGQEWLYVKLYGAYSVVETLLARTLEPLCEELRAERRIDHWHALRFIDPQPHLRLRLHGAPSELVGAVLARLRSACQRELADGRLWSIAIDTYQREVERYGGSAGVRAAERLWHLDSVLLAAVLRTAPSSRPMVAAVAVTRLLDGLGIPARADWHERQARGLRRWLGIERAPTPDWREQRALLAAWLDASAVPAALAGPLDTWARQAAPYLGSLGSPAISCTVDELAGSLAHMLCHRLLADDRRRGELNLHDQLARHHRSITERDAQRRAAALPEGV